MSVRKVKSAAKSFESNPDKIRKIVLKAMGRVSEIVGSTFGPGGSPTLIESDYPGIPNKNTKDGVTVFDSLGAIDPFEHLVIEQARDAAKRTAQEAGDGTTTATILAASIIENLFEYCKNNPKLSPQRIVREIGKVSRARLLPYVKAQAIKISEENKDLLWKVARISANGDDEMADAVIKAFDLVGYGEGSHVTIRELSGPHGYEVSQIDGFPMAIGLEDSIGKFHPAFINDQANQRCYMEKPLFLLYDGIVHDITNFVDLLEKVGQRYEEEKDDKWKNIVFFAHGFSDSVLTHLAFNFAQPNTLNIVTMATPRTQQANSQTHFLHDLAAFTGARVFGLKDQLNTFELSNLGSGMESFEAYRFRSTVVGESDQTNIEFRASELEEQIKNPESAIDKVLLTERLGKLTSGIAKLTIFAGSNGELKEAHDRCEDAVCAVRSAIVHGALPGGCRVAIDLALDLLQNEPEESSARNILAPSLISLPTRLLRNSGHTDQETQEVITRLMSQPSQVYDAESQKYGTAEETGVYDAARAVEQAIENAISIAGVMGTMGGIVAQYRDVQLEREEAAAESEFVRATTRSDEYVNEANERS